MNKYGRAVSALVSLILAISLTVPGAFLLRAEAVSAESIESAADEIISNEISLAGAGSLQALLDGKYSAEAGALSDWFVFSLIQYKGNSLNYDKYAAGLKAYCEKGNSHDTPVTKERFAIMFLLLGTNSEYIREVCSKSVGSLGIMSYIYGLHLIANGCTASKSESEVINAILGAQLDDGGWDLSNKASDPDVTAMAVQALAHYYSGNSQVKQAVDKALSLLSSMQLANGGFKSYGAENPESCAQVITALTALGVNPLNDNRFIKNGKSAVDAMLAYKTGSGGYSHKQGGEYNLTATSQVLYSLVSIYRLMKGAGSLYNLKTDIKVSTAPEKTTSQTAKQTSANNNPTAAAPARSRVNTQNIRPQATTAAAADSNQTAAGTKSETTAENRSQTVTFTAVSSTRERRSTETAKAEAAQNNKQDNQTAKRTEALTGEQASGSVSAPSKARETRPFTKAAGETAPAPVTAQAATASTSVLSEETQSFVSYEEEETSVYETDETYPAEDYTQAGKTAQNEENTKKNFLTKPKIIIIAAIWCIALAAALIFIIKKNKKAVNYLIIFGIAAALTAGTVLADIQTSDDYYRADGTSSSDTVTVTMSITCDTVKGCGDKNITPPDGIILPETEFTLDSGSTAYDCLIKAAKEYKIQIEDNTQALGNHSNAYIAGINYLYEFDYGELSGWMFSVNGEFADRGCGEYTLSDSDVIKWEYTCNMGDDLK